MKMCNQLNYEKPQMKVLFMEESDILTLSFEASGDAKVLDWSEFDISGT